MFRREGGHHLFHSYPTGGVGPGAGASGWAEQRAVSTDGSCFDWCGGQGSGGFGVRGGEGAGHWADSGP